MSLINVKDLTFAYDGSYENVFENTSFQIDTDWKLGFVGRNGRGKTTFLNILLGKYKYSGNITASVSFEYFPYEVEDKTKNTIEIFYDICPNCEDWEFMREISLLEVDFDVLYRPFFTLSNGELLLRNAITIPLPEMSSWYCHIAHEVLSKHNEPWL